MLQFLQSLPSPIAQGMIWGIMAIGVYITFRILDVADLTVDGTLGLGGAVLVVLTTGGINIWLSLFIAFIAGCIAGLITGVLGFNDTGTALMLTIFALQDSFGTACNVTGDGALTLILTGYTERHGIKEGADN